MGFAALQRAVLFVWDEVGKLGSWSGVGDQGKAGCIALVGE